MQFNPYLFFAGTCEEAFTFYASVFGGTISQLSRFSDMPPNPDFPIPEASKNNVMHARMTASGIALFGSDGRPGATYEGGNVSLSLSFDDVAAGQKVFDALSKGGEIETPLTDMFWGAKFGQFTDRFGIDWMVNIELKPAAASA